MQGVLLPAALAMLAVLFQLAHDGFRVDALTAVIVGQSSLDGLLGQDRAVDLDGRQTFQSFHNSLVGQFEGLFDGLALDEVGGHAAGGDGGTAAEGEELDINDDVVLDLQVHAHDVADKGFPISKIRKELAERPDLHYLAPLRRNDLRIKRHEMTKWEGILTGIEGEVLFKKVQTPDGRYLYGFRDRSMASAEEAGYLTRAKHGKTTFEADAYEKQREIGGVIVFESDLDMEPTVAYKCYADRWLIELVFRQYKNEVCLNKTRVQSDYSVWGDEFINFIATVLTCRMIRKLEQTVLLREATYGHVMDDLSSAWRRSDAPSVPRRDDGAWVHTTNVVFEMLEALGLCESLEDVSVEKPRRKPGRPKTQPEFVGPKRPRGRPKGSGTKKSVETTETQPEAPAPKGTVAKRRPGRPKGSKNKKTLLREAEQAATADTGAAPDGSERG